MDGWGVRGNKGGEDFFGAPMVPTFGWRRVKREGCCWGGGRCESLVRAEGNGSGKLKYLLCRSVMRLILCSRLIKLDSSNVSQNESWRSEAHSLWEICVLYAGQIYVPCLDRRNGCFLFVSPSQRPLLSTTLVQKMLWHQKRKCLVPTVLSYSQSAPPPPRPPYIPQNTSSLSHVEAHRSFPVLTSPVSALSCWAPLHRCLFVRRRLDVRFFRFAGVGRCRPQR